MTTRETNNRTHFETPGREASSNTATVPVRLSSNFHSTDKLLIGPHLVSTTDNHFQFSLATPRGCAPIVDMPTRRPETIGACNYIPEAGMCGFSWEDAS